MSVCQGNTLTEEKANHNFNILVPNMNEGESSTNRILCLIRTREEIALVSVVVANVYCCEQLSFICHASCHWANELFGVCILW